MEAFTIVWKNVPIVAFLLFLLSTISTAIFLERFLNAKKSKLLPIGWRQFKLALANANYEAAIAILRRDKKPFSRTLANLLELYIHKEITKSELYKLLENEIEILYLELSKRISFISSSVTLATLIGLIGTVFGLIEVFGAFSLTSMEGFKLLAKGIATSLNSTAAGLLVAIYDYILYWIVESRVKGVYSKILKEIDEVMELLK